MAAQTKQQKPSQSNGQETQATTPKLSVSGGPILSTILTFILIACLSTAVVFYAYVYLSKIEVPSGEHKISANIPQMQPTPTQASLPTPTASETNFEDYKVSVLNGVGVAGAANEVSDLLREDGFTVENISNASEFGFTQSLLQAKSEVDQSALVRIRLLLQQNNYSVVSGETIEATGSYDIVVTVGTKES